MLLEVMGRDAGWIALHAGIAGAADVILIPEIPYRIAAVEEAIEGRAARGQAYSLVVVAEGAVPEGGVPSYRTLDAGDGHPRLGGAGERLAIEPCRASSTSALHCARPSPARRLAGPVRPDPRHAHGRARGRARGGRAVGPDGLHPRRLDRRAPLADALARPSGSIGSELVSDRARRHSASVRRRALTSVAARELFLGSAARRRRWRRSPLR
jgi:hypothetical protein